MMHAFDGYEVSVRMWEACVRREDCSTAGQSTGGRESVTLIYRRLHDESNWANKDIPAYMFGYNFGVILNPKANQIICGYPGDGATQDANCDPGDQGCTPGCWHGNGWVAPCYALQLARVRAVLR